MAWRRTRESWVRSSRLEGGMRSCRELGMPARIAGGGSAGSSCTAPRRTARAAREAHLRGRTRGETWICFAGSGLEFTKKKEETTTRTTPLVLPAQLLALAELVRMDTGPDEKEHGRRGSAVPNSSGGWRLPWNSTLARFRRAPIPSGRGSTGLRPRPGPPGGSRSSPRFQFRRKFENMPNLWRRNHQQCRYPKPRPGACGWRVGVYWTSVRINISVRGWCSLICEPGGIICFNNCFLLVK